MKTKLAISILLGLLTAAFVFNNGTNFDNTNVYPSPPPAVPGDNDFLIGCLNNGMDTDFEYITGTFGFNLWHLYPGWELSGEKHYPTGWTANDKLTTNINYYKTEVHGILSGVENHNMRALMQRPKIEYLCYGQRSDYQCEPEAYVDENYWFYTFNDHNTGIPDTDSGNYVIHCRSLGSGPNHDDPGFVVKRLKTNAEQCHRNNGFDAYRWDSECDWYIKPKIRIDSNFAHNNLQTPVCSIKVIKQNGQTVLKNTIIRGINFINDQGNYDGRYLEEFYNFQSADDSLIIHGDWATGNDQWAYKARVNKSENEEDNKADIQVYWYGYCDMWIDYVRVDNNIAHNLLTTDLSNIQHQEFENWLLWEADSIACQGGASPYQFYIELFEFNQIPCIAYVNRKIDSIAYTNHGKHFNVLTDLLYAYEYHLNWDELGKINTPEQIKSTYFDRTGSRVVYVGDPYPLMGQKPECSAWTQTQSIIPGSLNITSGTKILGSTDSPGAYDTWLQGIFDNNCWFYDGGTPNYNYGLEGVFMYLLKHGDELSKLCNIPLITMLQAHQWVGGGEVDREPTTEELDLISNLSVSYGARGIIYWGIKTFDNSECEKSYGLMENGEPRDENVYGQPKLEKFQQTVGRLKTWGPTLMSFDNANRHSYIYRKEYEQCLNESYFRYVISYKPGTLQQYCAEWNNPQGIPLPPAETELIYECREDTYLQAATFETGNDEDVNYFMIVNRRCSPVKENFTDGKRKIKILFDNNHSEMSGYNVWKIEDIGNIMGVPIMFDKTQNLYVDLDWFEPGEGRLFKMTPLVQSGGVLIGNELITSGEEFTCEDTVWTNFFIFFTFHFPGFIS